jgi:hypothetical protein
MRGFDWSGRTTYWCSEHSMMPNDDAERLTAEICRALPGVVMLQPVWLWQPPRVRCRQIRFLIASDEIVRFAVGCEKTALDRILTADDVPLEEFERVLDPQVMLWRIDHGQDLTGHTEVKLQAVGRELAYDVIQHRRYRIWVEYRTRDAQANAVMQALLRVFETYFFRGVEIVDLETGEIVCRDWADEGDTKSYSSPFKDWCSERPGRYLHVGTHRPAGGGHLQFVGYRPIT